MTSKKKLLITLVLQSAVKISVAVIIFSIKFHSICPSNPTCQSKWLQGTGCKESSGNKRDYAGHIPQDIFEQEREENSLESIGPRKITKDGDE